MFRWANFLTYAIITAITPGPNNIMSMSNAGRLGFRKSLPFNMGVLVGFSAVMLVCTFFCNTLSDVLPAIQFPMRIIGALYLLWLAWNTWRRPPEIKENPARSGFPSGLLLQFVNPKIYIYCIVSMEAYILPFYQGKWDKLVFFSLLLSLIGFACTLCWALFGSVCKRLFSTYAKVTNAVMALLLVYCAASLFL